jgi:hypothetical protein
MPTFRITLRASLYRAEQMNAVAISLTIGISR